MDLWERGFNTGLVGDAEAEGASMEGRAASRGEEEDDGIARSYHNTVMSSKLRQSVHWETEREGGGCLLLDDQFNKTRRLVAEVLREKHPDMQAPPRGKSHVRGLR